MPLLLAGDVARYELFLKVPVLIEILAWNNTLKSAKHPIHTYFSSITSQILRCYVFFYVVITTT